MFMYYVKPLPVGTLLYHRRRHDNGGRVDHPDHAPKGLYGIVQGAHCSNILLLSSTEADGENQRGVR